MKQSQPQPSNMLGLARSRCLTQLRKGLATKSACSGSFAAVLPRIVASQAEPRPFNQVPHTKQRVELHHFSNLRQRLNASAAGKSGAFWQGSPRSKQPLVRSLTNSGKADADLNSLKDDLKENAKKDEVVSDGKKVVCEFTIQVLFNFLSCSAVAMAVKNSGGDAVLQTLQVMGAHAVILPLIIYSALETSGAHFNPMITACFVAVGKLPAKLGLAYVAAQLVGGVIGAGLAFASLPRSMQTLAHAGIQAVPATSTVAQAFLGEVMAAFSLVFVLFATNVDPRCNWGKLKPLSIPMIITLLMWLVGPVSSMCINPARAFGPAVITGFWENHWIWWTAPFVGGITAAKLYQGVLLPKKFRTM